MEFEKIISRERYRCDKFVATACAMIAGFTVLIWGLNLLGVFVVEPSAMAFCAIMTAILLSFPLAVFLLRKNGRFLGLNYPIFSLVFSLLSVGILYSFLTFHVIFVFLFPSIVFNIYGSKKLMKWTMAGTLLVMIASHVAGVYFGVNPEEPFTEMRTV